MQDPKKSKRKERESVGLDASYHIQDPALRAVFAQNPQRPIALRDLPEIDAKKALALQDLGKKGGAFLAPYDEDDVFGEQKYNKEIKGWSWVYFIAALKQDIIQTIQFGRPVLFLASFMLGIGGYFTLPVEPSWSALALPLAFMIIFTLLALKFQSAVAFFFALVMLLMGAFVRKISTFNHIQAKITPPQHVATLYARVWEAHSREQGYGMVIEPLFMSSRQDEKPLPKRLAIYSRKKEAPPEIELSG